MLSARSLPSLPTTTLSEIELNGGHHQLWSGPEMLGMFSFFDIGYVGVFDL